MKKYIGKKEVQAELMNEFTAVELGYARPNEDHHEWREGYHVVYPDGYHSWSPLNVFEQSYKCSESFLDRLLIEAEELAEKKEKLNKFMSTESYKNLGYYERKLLEAQFGSMLSYLTILQIIISNEYEKLNSPNCCIG